MESLSPPPASKTIAIVGGGFSGALVAVHLARMTGSQALRIVLFEKRERFARGLAYGTRCDLHLLNVPAGLMSALPDEPSHFLDWLRARDPSAQPGTFAPRRLYGDYLEELLASSARASTAQIDLVRDEVIDLEVGEGSPVMRLTTRAGTQLLADRVVLATGHQPPLDPPGCDLSARGPGYVADPWNPRALEGLQAEDSIALIGTGLTAVDVVLEARSRGHVGKIYAISRHGLLPRQHPASSVPPRPHFAIPGPGPAPTARTLLRRVRSEVVDCEREGGDWRSVIDSVRPVAQALWRSLGAGERRRFVRHVAPRWEVHRHRVAPEVDAVLQDARSSGQLNVIAGRIHSFAERDGHPELTIERRGTACVETLAVRRVINCTGPARDVRAGSPELLRSALDRGIVRTGPLAMGLDVADSGALIRADGREQTQIFAIGPLLKEQLWETTAVRELRCQAVEIARKVLE
jgi:uncharacterized NAD(P)/FAD-binding protein YdhS